MGGTLHLSWRVPPVADRRDGCGRLYSAVDASLVGGALRGADVVHEEEALSAFSAAAVQRLIVGRR